MSSLRHNIKYHFILFFISPVLGILYGLKSKSLVYMRWSIFGFVVLYGSLFNESFLGDGKRHWANVYDHYLYLDFSVFWSELWGIMMFDHVPEVNDDPYIHILSYFVGTILNAPGLFFVFVAAIYGYFYSGVMVKIIDYINWKSKYNKFYFGFFLILLILWKTPSSMQTVRTWTGMWVLLYAILSYHDSRKKKYFLLALTPPLIHMGFYALSLPIWVVLLTGYRNPKIYFIIFILSIFFSNALQQTNFSSIASKTSVGASKVRQYTMDDERIERIAEKTEEKLKSQNFYKKFEKFRLHINVLSALIIFIFIVLRNRGFTNFENTLFSYGLAMASFSNFFTSIYAVHNRGWEIAAILILSLLVVFLSNHNLKKMQYSFFTIRLPFFIFIIFLVPYFLYLLSNVLSFTSPFLFFLPAISWIEPEIAMSIRELIGLFF